MVFYTIFCFSLQLAKALGAQQEGDDEWEAFKQSQLGDTTGLTE